MLRRGAFLVAIGELQTWTGSRPQANMTSTEAVAPPHYFTSVVFLARPNIAAATGVIFTDAHV